MPECPKCKKEITYLHEYTEHIATIEVDENWEIVRLPLGEVTDGSEYVCPMCDEVIFDNYGETETFLLNTKEVTEDEHVSSRIRDINT